jgi:Uma2 family endonuclease
LPHPLRDEAVEVLVGRDRGHLEPIKKTTIARARVGRRPPVPSRVVDAVKRVAYAGVVKATLHLDRRATYADYLAVEHSSRVRHEYLDGVIVAMAGGSDEHNAIMMQFGVLCANRCAGNCRTYPADQRFWIAASGRGRYSDGSVICGAPHHPPHDDQATTNPVIVVEVLSPSSEGDDDGDQRLDFQSLPSLQAYVIAAQDERRVRVYRRGAHGEWRVDADVYRDSQSFELPVLSSAIAVADIYDGILGADGRSLLK